MKRDGTLQQKLEVCLTSHVWTPVAEKRLQEAMARVLEETARRLGAVVERECVLGPGSRIDFRVSTSRQRVGIEVKVKGDLASVQRQLERYANDPRLDAVILATTRTKHLQLDESLPGRNLRVPVCVVHLRPF